MAALAFAGVAASAAPQLRTEAGSLYVDLPTGADLIVRPEGSAQFSVTDLFNRVVALEAASAQHGIAITDVTTDLKTESEKTTAAISALEVSISDNINGQIALLQDEVDDQATPFTVVSALAACDGASAGLTSILKKDDTSDLYVCNGAEWSELSTLHTLGKSADTAASSCAAILAVSDFTPQSGPQWVKVGGTAVQTWCSFTGDEVEGDVVTDLGGPGAQSSTGPPAASCFSAIHAWGQKPGVYNVNVEGSSIATYCDADGNSVGDGLTAATPAESCKAISDVYKDAATAGVKWIGDRKIKCVENDDGELEEVADGSDQHPMVGALQVQLKEHCGLLYENYPAEFADTGNKMEGGAFFAFGEGTSRLYQEVGISKHDAAVACGMKGGELSKGNAVVFGNGQSAVFSNNNEAPSQFVWEGGSKGLVSDVSESDQVHGPWGNTVKDISGEFQSTVAGACHISFVMYGIDTRDGEEDSVVFNGNVIWKATREGLCTGPWQHVTGEMAKNIGVRTGDLQCFMLVTKTTVCLEGKNTIQFKSNIDQVISDESWAFSNVMVWSALDKQAVQLLAIDKPFAMSDPRIAHHGFPVTSNAFDLGPVQALQGAGSLEPVSAPATIKWSHTKRKALNGGGGIHGQFDNGQRNIVGVMNLDQDKSTDCVVQWISWYIDSRDNEFDSVFWNGAQIWRDRARYTCEEAAWTSATKSLGFYLPWSKGNRQTPCYQEVTRKVKCSPGNNELNFKSDINQAITDESWGFSNIKVWGPGGVLIANDNPIYRISGYGFDAMPAESAMLELFQSDDESLLFWTNDQTEDSGTPAGTRNGFTCDFKNPSWHYGDEQVPFHCTCPGADPEPATCEARLGGSL